ncbi:YciI family protein [Marinobacterium sp. D7]|uniref:YciI family protein n=1 Tax=Marinobacterium ramblicola TaxID=2849041 RepID=UPI001C2CD48A|nr:YciI family protein [Marinobacterium ramblicola]MBV1788523.1 YciI family protein [Marinobacterium ramblicola]
MKYLCLVYYNEAIMKKMSQAEWDGLNRECIACVEDLSAAGHFLDGAPLQTTDSATTLRVRDGKALVTDGPFAETKEQLAGFYMLEAQDLNEAIRLAEKIPPARYGSVEIRPVRELLESNNILGSAV